MIVQLLRNCVHNLTIHLLNCEVYNLHSGKDKTTLLEELKQQYYHSTRVKCQVTKCFNESLLEGRSRLQVPSTGYMPHTDSHATSYERDGEILLDLWITYGFCIDLSHGWSFECVIIMLFAGHAHTIAHMLITYHIRVQTLVLSKTLSNTFCLEFVIA